MSLPEKLLSGNWVRGLDLNSAEKTLYHGHSALLPFSLLTSVLTKEAPRKMRGVSIWQAEPGHLFSQRKNWIMRSRSIGHDSRTRACASARACRHPGSAYESASSGSRLRRGSQRP